MPLARRLSPMAIESIIGLPHLREGPILNRQHREPLRLNIYAYVQKRGNLAGVLSSNLTLATHAREPSKARIAASILHAIRFRPVSRLA